MREISMRLYRYVGPRQIADRAGQTASGSPIRAATDVRRWVRESGQLLDPASCVIATFVIDATGTLLIADRHSEHVACAGGQPVKCAGDMTVRVLAEAVAVVAVSNQSTGYCPEPASWPAVAAALLAAGLEPPAGFDRACDFRICPRCAGKQLVKDAVYECAVCGTELPTVYNCQ